MIPASPEYQAALKLSHVAETRAVILKPTADNTYEDGETLLVQGGNLTIDGTRNIWRTGSLNLAPDNVFFTDPLDQVTGATRLRIDRGIRMFKLTRSPSLSLPRSSRSLRKQCGRPQCGRLTGLWTPQ